MASETLIERLEKVWTSYLAMSQRAPRESLIKEIKRIREGPMHIPLIIGGREVWTDELMEVKYPHDHSLVQARAYMADEGEIELAVDTALDAWDSWAFSELETRARIFRRAGYPFGSKKAG